MIRAAEQKDVDAMLQVAEEVGLFESEQLQLLRKMFLHSQETVRKDESYWCVAEEQDELVGVAFCEQEVMTDRTWNLRFIGVCPSYHRQGRGRQLLRHIEQDLSNRAARLVLIDTAGIEDFRAAQNFYRSNGYKEEASVADFYADGVSKVTFWKRLPAPAKGS